MTWHVWTDGSCKYEQDTPAGGRGAGGWTAIVEHHLDGFVLRGREPDTTNVRMELVAMIEGVRSTPFGADVVLHVDCTVVFSVVAALEQGTLAHSSRRDSPLWRELGAELAERRYRIDLLGKGVRDPIHLRAHGYAGAEARACLLEMPANATPLEGSDLRLRRRRLARASIAAMRVPQEGVRAGKVRLQHHGGCSSGFCVYGCPVWRHRHPNIALPQPPPGY